MLVIFTDNHSYEISKDKAISNCSSFMDQVTLFFLYSSDDESIYIEKVMMCKINESLGNI